MSLQKDSEVIPAHSIFGHMPTDNLGNLNILGLGQKTPGGGINGVMMELNQNFELILHFFFEILLINDGH